MMTRVIAGFLCLALAEPASAGGGPKEEIRMRKIAYDYAKCVVRKSHDKVREVVLAAQNNYEIIRRYPQIIDSDCLTSAAGYGVDMRFPNDTYMSAMSNALVNADFATRGETSFANRLPLAQPMLVTEQQKAERLGKIKSARKRAELQKQIEQGYAIAWLARYGECVVRENPEGARYWLLTPADTPEETSRIKALQPAFSVCLGAGTMKFDRVRMRGTVAVNYYRLASATAVTAAEGAR